MVDTEYYSTQCSNSINFTYIQVLDFFNTSRSYAFIHIPDAVGILLYGDTEG